MGLVTYRFGNYNIDCGPFFTEVEGTIGIADLDGFVPTIHGYIPVPRGYPVGYDFGTAYANITTRVDIDSLPISLYSFIDLDGNNRWFFLKTNAAGATADIQRVTGASISPTSVGRAGGYTDTTHGWFMTRYGDTLIATNGVDAVQRGTLTTAFSKNNDTSGTPTAADPRCKYVETFKGHLFYGNCDFTAGSSGTAPETYGGAFGSLLAKSYPNLLMHSALDNERRFGTPITTPAIIGADFRHLYDGLGPITGLKACTDYMAVFRKKGVTILTGPPFNVQNIDESIGTSAHNSIVRVGSDIYFWSNRGPAVIRGGSSFELLSSGIFSEVMSISRTQDRAIYGAVTVDSKYVVWTCQFDSSSALNTFYVYCTESDRFGKVKESAAGNVIPMTSYYIPEANIQPPAILGSFFIQTPFKRYSPLEGISFIANSMNYNVGTPIGATASDIFMLSGSANNTYYNITSTGPIGTDDFYGIFGDLASIRTHWFQLPGSETTQAFSIKRIRPIYWTGATGVHSNPVAATASEFDDEVKINKIRVYSTNRYESTTAASYLQSNSLSDDGWISLDGCPQSELFSVEFFFENNYNLRLVYGFEMEFVPLSETGYGKHGLS